MDKGRFLALEGAPPPAPLAQSCGNSNGKNELSGVPESRAWRRPKIARLSLDAASFDRGGHMRLPRAQISAADWLQT